jgi:hypothetical protein
MSRTVVKRLSEGALSLPFLEAINQVLSAKRGLHLKPFLNGGDDHFSQYLLTYFEGSKLQLSLDLLTQLRIIINSQLKSNLKASQKFILRPDDKIISLYSKLLGIKSDNSRKLIVLNSNFLAILNRP